LAVVYFTVPARDLPSVLGRVGGSAQFRRRRADAAVLTTLIFWVGAISAFRVRRHRLARRHRPKTKAARGEAIDPVEAGVDQGAHDIDEPVFVPGLDVAEPVFDPELEIVLTPAKLKDMRLAVEAARHSRSRLHPEQQRAVVEELKRLRDAVRLALHVLAPPD
jgi:hypothetical protein